MEQIFIAYGVLKETVAAVKMFSTNPKVVNCTLDSSSNFFDIVTGVLQGDAWLIYTRIIK